MFVCLSVYYFTMKNPASEAAFDLRAHLKNKMHDKMLLPLKRVVADLLTAADRGEFTLLSLLGLSAVF